MTKHLPHFFIIFSVFVLLLISCSSPATSHPQVIQETSPTSSSNSFDSSVEIITLTSAPMGLRIGDSVPPALREQIASWDLPANASVHLDISPSMQLNSTQTNIQWIYALVAPFPTVKDGVTFD